MAPYQNLKICVMKDPVKRMKRKAPEMEKYLQTVYPKRD